MRTVNVIIALSFVLALMPLRAAQPALTAAEACARLEAQARALIAAPVRCETGAEGLMLMDAPAASWAIVQRALFPERIYLGYAVVTAQTPTVRPANGPSRTVSQAQAASLQAATARLLESPALAQAVIANFDNAAYHPNLALLVAGPPGSGGGPPGSGNGPPGSQRPGGPPGSGNPPGNGNPPGGGTPPGGSAPPSRPAPVWRSSFPPPMPNWWNTDFNHYNWWTGLPSGYDRPRIDQNNPDSLYYYSGWYRWRDVFVTDWERTEDSATISRTAANQGQVHSRTLTSEVYREAKECYYQAVYRYDWAQGGFNGSHWEENFDHYQASCIRLPRQYGQPRAYTTDVSFDMSLVSGQDLPWESDIIRITYDGQGQPRYDFSGAAYTYSTRLDSQRWGGERVTLIAGAKNPRAPEADKVQAFLRVNAGKLELVVNDDRTQYYQGETLRVNARVVRRVVIKVKGILWGWNEKNVDSLIYSSPLNIQVRAGAPENVTDLTAAASAPLPANAVRSSVFIDSWEFSRVNSRISTGAVIRKGQGNSLSY